MSIEHRQEEFQGPYSLFVALQEAAFTPSHFSFPPIHLTTAPPPPPPQHTHSHTCIHPLIVLFGKNWLPVIVFCY